MNRSGRLPQVNTERCTGCGRCVAVCAPHVLSLEVERWRKSAVLHGQDRCTGCSLCALHCPFGAIAMVKAPPTGCCGPGERGSGWAGTLAR